MSWIGITQRGGWTRFNPDGIDAGVFRGRVPSVRLPQGTLVVETARPDPFGDTRVLISHARQVGRRNVAVRLEFSPDGRVTFIALHGMQGIVFSLDVGAVAEGHRMRIAYGWDTDGGRALLSAEDLETGRIYLCRRVGAHALSLGDLGRIVCGQPTLAIGPDVSLLAVSDRLEPTGFATGVTAGTLVATAAGPAPIETLRPGDMVRLQDGTLTPLVARIARRVPALGGFAPVVIRRPCLGLAQCLVASRDLRLVARGPEAEYLFHDDGVWLPAGVLAATDAPAEIRKRRGTVTYHALLLQRHEPVLLNGLWCGSVDLSGLGGAGDLAASAPKGVRILPDHDADGKKVLTPLEAQALLTMRAA